MTVSEVYLRAATHDDLDAIYPLFAQVQQIHANAAPDFFRPPENGAAVRSYFAKILDEPDQHLILACRDEIEIGYIFYSIETRSETIFHTARRFIYIHQLSIAAEDRRTGCGTLLIDHVKQEAVRLCIAEIGIDFWSFNDAARGCFTRSGFDVRKEFMWLTT